MHYFTEKCMNNTIPANILSRQSLWKKFLIDSINVQPLISSHLYKEADFLYLLKSAYPRDTLIIHTHREEGTRLPSAIKNLANNHICGDSPYQQSQRNKMLHLDVRKNDTHCILDEEAFLQVIADKDVEIGMSTHRLLTCQTFQAMEENAPQLVILNYKQIDKLNELLAKRYCPEMLDELPMNSNAATDNPMKVLLRRNGTDVNRDTVDIDEWLRGKGSALEWTLKLREKASCQRKTLRMEDELFGCRDEALRVTPESVERW